jgi:hypothetical protein
MLMQDRKMLMDLQPNLQLEMAMYLMDVLLHIMQMMAGIFLPR